MEATNFSGTWITRDGYLKHHLQPNGVYLETRGKKEQVLQGKYSLKGKKIVFNNDNGYVATGSIEAGLLYKDGHTFFPEECFTQAATICF